MRQLAVIRNPVLPSQLGGSGTASGASILGLLVGNIIGGILIIGFLLSLFMLLTGAVQWITSGGEKGSLESARNRIIHAILGLIILASVWAVMMIVAPFVGLTFPQITIPTIGG